MPAVAELVEPYPSEAAAIRGLTGTVVVQGMAAPRAAWEGVEMQQAEAAQGKVAATVALVVAAPRQAGARQGRIAAPLFATARRGRAVAYPAEAAMVFVAAVAGQEKAAPRAGPAAEVGARALAGAHPDGVATDPAAVTADQGKAGATIAPVVVEPLLDVPVVRSMAAMGRAAVPALAGAAARQGMTKAGLVVETPAARRARIEPYPVEEAAGALYVRQQPEAQVYFLQEVLAAPCARHSEILPPSAVVAAGVRFAPLEASLLLLKPQGEALAPHLRYLGGRGLAEH
jgi:hypothetical protein